MCLCSKTGAPVSKHATPLPASSPTWANWGINAIYLNILTQHRNMLKELTACAAFQRATAVRSCRYVVLLVLMGLGVS